MAQYKRSSSASRLMSNTYPVSSYPWSDKSHVSLPSFLNILKCTIQGKFRKDTLLFPHCPVSFLPPYKPSLLQVLTHSQPMSLYFLKILPAESLWVSLILLQSWYLEISIGLLNHPVLFIPIISTFQCSCFKINSHHLICYYWQL